MKINTVAIISSGLIAGGLIATGGYWYGSPYLAVNAIREAVDRNDGEQFNEFVDYQRLREDLKAYVVSSLTQGYEAETSGEGDEGMAALGMAFMLPIANTMIDSYLTPEVVEGLIDSNDRSSRRPQKKKANPFTIPDIQGQIANSKKEFEKQMNQMDDIEMGYSGMDKFLVSGRVDQGIKVGFEMSRQGLGDWKISGLILPNYQQLQALAPDAAAYAENVPTIPPENDLKDSSVEAIRVDEEITSPSDGVNKVRQMRGVNLAPPDLSTCWFQMQSSNSELTGFHCTVTSRVNANGNTVYDVIEPNGLKRAIVLWDNYTAEVFLKGQRYEGNWGLNQENNVHIELPQGSMAFRRPG